MKIKVFLAVISLFVAGTLMAQSTSAPKREFRSSWIAGINIDFAASLGESGIKTRLTQYLDAMQAQHFTGVCFHVRSHGDAYYRSDLEPWSQYISGTRGKDPGWDPLEWMVTECHKRGMECYAWVNPFRVSTSGVLTSTSFDRQWNSNGWLLQGTATPGYVVFNPGIPAARQHCLDVIKDIYTRYNIDGMLFDDYFYPAGGTAEDATAGDYNLWKNSGTDLSIGDWRRENVNSFVKEVYDAIQADRPDIRFGISPRGVGGASGDKYGVGKPNVSSSDGMYSEIYCDPLAWLNEGTVDFISPQIYWPTTHNTAPFEPLAQWWDKVSAKFNRQLYVSPAAYRLGETSGTSYIGGNTATGWNELATQVGITRENVKNGSCGMIWYSTKWLNGPTATGLGDYLLKNEYTAPSLIPAVTWKDAPVYDAPSGLKLSGTTLSWTAVPGARTNSIIRYTVYAVPEELSVEEAADARGDGLDSKYLLGITYDPAYTLSSAKASGCWYAVCVYDGYGLESKPATLNYVARDPAPKPLLVAPEAGTTLGDGDIVFEWFVDDITGIDSYVLEVCKSGDGFANVLHKATVTGTTASVSARKLGNGTFDWRITAKGSGLTSTASDIASFTVADLPAGTVEEGYIPVTDGSNYDEVDNLVIESLWFRSTKDGFGNMNTGFDISGSSTQRGMVATTDAVYVTRRSANSASANTKIFLDKYSPVTGEFSGALELDDKAAVHGLYPNNDVIKDNAGNLVISNLSTNIRTNNIYLYKVDTETGDLTLVARLGAPAGSTSTSYRVDHVGIYGDVTSEPFYVFAGVANASSIFRWTINDPETTVSPTSYTIRSFYPTSAGTLGSAPRVIPVSATQVWVDGSNTAMTLYTLNTGNRPGQTTATATATFASASSLKPTAATDNGGALFTFQDKPYIVYNCEPSTGNSSYGKFNVARMSSANSLTDLTKMWTIPAEGIGSKSSGTMGAPVDVVEQPDKSAHIYLYTPANGLAAYRMYDKSGATGVDDIAADKADAAFRVTGRTVTLDGARGITAYSLSGAVVATSAGDTLVLPAPGTYIVAADLRRTLVAVR
ncbi:MAG: family 10 glycosylhydrolase [Muribaculaceae bacterium]